MGDFCLVGCVRGVPLRVFQDIALDDLRDDRRVVPLTLVGFEYLVETSKSVHFLDDSSLGVQSYNCLASVLEDLVILEANGGWHSLIDELVKRIQLEVVEDVLHLLVVVADVASDLFSTVEQKVTDIDSLQG